MRETWARLSSLDVLIQEEGVSTFQHFWTDGIFSDGPEGERLAQLNAMALIACAEVEGTGRGPATQPEILGHESLRRYDSAELAYVVGRLVERRVLRADADRLRIRVPLLSTWLRGPGAAAVRASFGERDLEMALAPSRAGISSQDIVEIARDLVYQEAQVNEIRIKAWLEQFGSARHQRLVLLLLGRLKAEGYYSNPKVHNIFKTLHSLVVADQASSGKAQIVRRGRTTNVFVASLDPDGKSGGFLTYRYRVANEIPSALVGSSEQAIDFLKRATASTAVIFIDDFIGTGRTFIENFGRFAKLLSDTGIDRTDISFYLVTVIGLTAGVEAIRMATDSRVKTFTGGELGARCRAFSPEAGIFSTDSERVEAEQLCRTIGEALEPKHPLGYDDSQALVVFSHRCPNNSLPIFYKSGRQYQGRDWQPLFPR